VRAKTLLAVALAAGIATSAVAQSNIYSLNVVGYYQVPVSANQKVMLGNQLHTTNDTLAVVIPNPPPRSQFFKYNGGFSGYSFDDLDEVWVPDGNVSLAPGEGGFFLSPVATTLTFMGEVMQGSLTNTLPINTKVIRTSIVPQAGRVTADLGLPGEPYDELFTWPSQSGGYIAFSFDDIDLAWFPFDASNAVGQSFFYIKSGVGTHTNWIRNFTVQ
jgi:hypothetical protein